MRSARYNRFCNRAICHQSLTYHLSAGYTTMRFLCERAYVCKRVIIDARSKPVSLTRTLSSFIPYYPPLRHVKDELGRESGKRKVARNHEPVSFSKRFTELGCRWITACLRDKKIDSRFTYTHDYHNSPLVDYADRAAILPFSTILNRMRG